MKQRLCAQHVAAFSTEISIGTGVRCLGTEWRLRRIILGLKSKGVTIVTEPDRLVKDQCLPAVISAILGPR